MPTFPTFDRAYAHDGYSYDVGHEVLHTEFFSGNTRQRKLFDNHNDVFSVSLVLSNAELVTFENFVTNDLDYGANTYTGPYFTSDVEYTGTLQMVDGAYDVELMMPNHWKVSFNFEVLDRDMSEEDNIYAAVNSLGTISNMDDVLSALADMVNNNTLE